jgi:hypothetical protein
MTWSEYLWRSMPQAICALIAILWNNARLKKRMRGEHFERIAKFHRTDRGR